jgi:hypothetical protein
VNSTHWLPSYLSKATAIAHGPTACRCKLPMQEKLRKGLPSGNSLDRLEQKLAQTTTLTTCKKTSINIFSILIPRTHSQPKHYVLLLHRTTKFPARTCQLELIVTTHSEPISQGSPYLLLEIGKLHLNFSSYLVKVKTLEIDQQLKQSSSWPKKLMLTFFLKCHLNSCNLDVNL